MISLFSHLLQAMPEFDPTIAEEFGEIGVGLSFLGSPLFDGVSFLNLLIRFCFNLLVGFVVVRCFYLKKSHRSDYSLTFLIFSAVMFLLIFCMGNVKLQIGLTLGLFAIFGMIRYRTDTIPVREMTYLFVIIGLSVINGLALELSYAELLTANLLIVLMIWAGDGVRKGRRSTGVKMVRYDKIDLITPDKREELKADLKKRLGVEVTDVEVGAVDFLRDSCMLSVSYLMEEGVTSNSVDSVKKF